MAANCALEPHRVRKSRVGLIGILVQETLPYLFCSQVHWDGWYEQLGGDDSPLADAILDRIVYDAYRIHIQSIDPKKDQSMREVYGLDKRLPLEFSFVG